MTDLEVKRDFIKEVESSAREIKRASEKFAIGWIPSHDELEDLRNQTEKIRRGIRDSGYDHNVAEAAALGIGLSEMVPSPDRGGAYFETPPGSALLPLWDKLIQKDGADSTTYPMVTESFFTITAVGLEPNRSEILFDTILNAKPADKIETLREKVFFHLNGEDGRAANNIQTKNSDSISAERAMKTTDHYIPKLENLVPNRTTN
jgi:hypothetical protein